MRYRVCKSFTVESGHLLSKHPGACRYPHGHTRRVDVVLSSETLDDRDMVCDFKAIKLAVEAFIDRFDHAMAVNSDDPRLSELRAASGDRLIVFEGEDPTTEVLARVIFERLAAAVRDTSTPLRDPKDGAEYRFPAGLRLERVRVTETPTSWGEYGVD
ncbi:MAG: 6-pyruvoyl trahydropterin synthase family protein [Phycisphaerales bacterium]